MGYNLRGSCSGWVFYTHNIPCLLIWWVIFFVPQRIDHVEKNGDSCLPPWAARVIISWPRCVLNLVIFSSQVRTNLWHLGSCPCPFTHPKASALEFHPLTVHICLKFLITYYKDINEHFFLNKPDTIFRNSLESPGGSVLCRKTLSCMIWMVVFTKL